MKEKQALPELLAPAGNLECALTAYKYGADAVYAGLGRFNAREMGQNFSLSDMSKLSAYAKKQGRKYYLTLNTLVKETEISDLFSFLDKVKKLEPDGIIIQDLGVLGILKKYYPEFSVHASTQMGFHNSPGLETASNLGFDRVILERQVTLNELKTIVPASPVEVEVFIHGALCCGLSGHCLFSSWIGGWSGNRGRCKQPCRRRYHGTCEGEKVSGFFFSPQDLYSLDLIGELKELGIASLKIEGRLKQPDYIRNVVSAYRQVLDAPSGQEEDVLKEARLTLSGSLGRRWSHGFFIEEELGDLLQYDSMGVSGQLVGSVEQTKGTGFRVRLIRRIHLGDRLRIQPRSGEEGPAVTVTRISLGTRPVNVGRKDDTVFIHCDKEIPFAGLVYKIGESRKEDTPNMDSLPEHNPGRKVDLEIRIDHKGMSARALNLRGREGEVLAADWREPPDPASNRPIEPDMLKELFSATRDAGFRSGRIDVEIIGSWFIPAGILKQRRREFWDLVIQSSGDEEEEKPTLFTFPAKKETAGDSPGRILSILSDSKQTDQIKTSEKEIPGLYKTILVRPAGTGSGSSPDEEILLPHFCPQGDLSALRETVQKEVAQGCRRFRITGLYQLSLLAGLDGLILSSSYPLPAANSFAVEQLGALGVKRVQAWIELESEALMALKKHSSQTLELYQQGVPFLLATRAPVHASGKISDSRGTTFITRLDESGNLTYIYPEETLKLPLVEGMDIFQEIISDQNEKTSTFNFYQEWV